MIFQQVGAQEARREHDEDSWPKVAKVGTE